MRKLAASKLADPPRPATGMVKAMAVGFGLPVPASIAARSSAKMRTPLKETGSVASYRSTVRK